MQSWTTLADDQTLTQTVKALEINGFTVFVVNTAEEARAKVLEIIPEHAEVMNMGSKTLEATGLTQDIMESGRYVSIKKKIGELDRATQGKEMRILGDVPDWAVGSVHAVTQDGHVMIASNSGSQLPAYVQGAEHVVWVVGTQKIVKNLEEGTKRIYEHSLKLEDERVKVAYGMPHSFVSSLLTMNRNPREGRITIILVKQVLGF